MAMSPSRVLLVPSVDAWLWEGERAGNYSGTAFRVHTEPFLEWDGLQ